MAAALLPAFEGAATDTQKGGERFLGQPHTFADRAGVWRGDLEGPQSHLSALMGFDLSQTVQDLESDVTLTHH